MILAYVNVIPTTKVVVRSSQICLGSRRWPTPQAGAMLELSLEAQQGLADLLPVLLCGEESAEHVFSNAALHESVQLNHSMRAGLASIADDERQHGLLLLTLRNALPSTQDISAVMRSVRFLKSMASADLKTHLTRVAALDAGVCIVLAEIARAGTPIARNETAASIFARIRRDEGRHVRISRTYSRVLGVDAQTEAIERRKVIAGFYNLLSPSGGAFSKLGVDPRHLLKRLQNYGSAVQINEAMLA